MNPRVTTAAFLSAALAWQIANLPRVADYRLYAYEDPGASLRVQTMMERGLVPTDDFNYFYGPASVALSRTWFGAFGSTPAAYAALVALLGLVIAWGLARFAIAAELPVILRLFLMAVMPHVINPAEPNFIHAVERGALVHGLAFQLRGQRKAALVLAVLAASHKPSVAAVYAALLLVWEFIDWLRGMSSFLAPMKSLALAAGLALLLALPVFLAYGAGPTLAMQIPLDGMRAYAAAGMGFFGPEGRIVWDPQGRAVTYYLGTGVGLWLGSVAVTLLAGLAALVRRTRVELPVTLAVLQLAALAAFANCWSWTYFSVVSFLGVAAAVGQIERANVSIGRCLAGGALVAAVAGSYSILRPLSQHWRESVIVAEGWLVMPRDVFDEWSAVQRQLTGPYTVLADGHAEALDSRAVVPDVWFLIWARTWRPREELSVIQSLEMRTVLRPVREPRYESLWLTKMGVGIRLCDRHPLFEGRYFRLLDRPGTAP